MAKQTKGRAALLLVVSARRDKRVFQSDQSAESISDYPITEFFINQQMSKVHARST